MKNKNMRNFLLIGLYFVLTIKEVLTESEQEIKRGVYPFMAFVYYPNEPVESSDTRFARSAVLIKPEWLVSSSLQTNETKLGFPRSTLIARVGAIVIDSNFTFNEDENEQEREVIQLVRPINFSSSPWWYNDITILKTLLPFNLTTAVAPTTPTAKHDYMDKSCYILVYAKKYTNSSDEKFLLQLPVELSPSSNDNCGVHFRKETMICASDSDENKHSMYGPEFCHNNAGGPLMCDGSIIGLQTYINNNCKQPYLYQSLSFWDDFITCAVEEKSRIQECANICDVIDKDTIVTAATNQVNVSMLLTKAANQVLMDQSSEDSGDDEHVVLPETVKETVAVVTESEIPTPTITPKDNVTTVTELTSVAITETQEKSTRTTDSEASWPKEKFVENRKRLDKGEDSDKNERKASVEAQRHEVKKKGRNAADSPIIGIVGLYYSLAFELLFITYFI